MGKRLRIEDMHNIAAERGGKCLSTKYIHSKTKIKWECAEGHTWEANPNSVKSGSWCSICSRARLTIEDMHKIAAERNGKCLSTKYINAKKKIKWECVEGHTWEATRDSVKKGKWCLICSGKAPLTLEQMHKIAAERNGKCLSTEYINIKTKLKWECAEGHTWEATPNNVKNGSWCLICSGSASLTIEEMHKIAAERNGKCLSTEYINTDTKIKWECAEGHTWEATPNSVKFGSWCGRCHIYYSEELCRTTFEQLFNKDFVKTRPHWLVGIKGHALELDGYCEDYKIAFEYNGEQHYRNLPFHKNKILEEIKVSDNLKLSLCRENGVYLFVITYKDDLTQLPQLIKNRAGSLEPVSYTHLTLPTTPYV